MQSETYHTCSNYPDKEINAAWENNEQIQGIAFGEGKWILLTSAQTSYGLQRWATNAVFPADEIKEGWDEGFDIIFLSYVNDRWVVIQAKQSGFTDQIWRTSSQFPEKEIQQGYKDGYAVTSLSYGVDRWAVVMSKGTKTQTQYFETLSSFPEDLITAGWNRGRDITSLAYGDGKWALIMSDNTGFVTQSWATRGKFDKALIQEKAKAGFSISEMFYADEMWVYVFTKFPNAKTTESSGATARDLINTPLPEPSKNPAAVTLFEKGKKHSEDSEYAQAIDCFKKAIKLEPEYYSAYNSLGVTLDLAGNKNEALDNFRKAFEYCETDPVILSNLICQVIDCETDVDEIIQAVEKAKPEVTEGIENAITYNNIGFAYAEKDKFETAIAYYKKGLLLDPENEILKSNLAEAEKSQAESHIGRYEPGEPTPVESPDTIESLMKELNKLTGLEEIKSDLDALIKYIKVEKKRKERGIALGNTTLHTVFAGPPGTGKTTMARLMGRFFKTLGILKKGHVVEVDRTALVAEFVGQTGIKTNKVIDSALDGILFIDEAYSLVPSGSKGDFGEEAVNILVKRMEDHKHNLIVIVAGYTDEMKRFINSNPGLQHRFTRYFYFKDYSAAQLTVIFEAMCNENKFLITDEAEAKVRRYFDFLYQSKDKQFGNARTARNLFEEAVRYQSARLGLQDVDRLSDEELLTITVDDIKASVQDEFEDKDVETVEEIMAELNKMVGLKEIKENVISLVNYIKTQQKLIQNGYEADPITLHSVFFGPPGTGKTTVARLLGRIYKALGLLPKGHSVEVSRADLVAEFVGQTAPKTNQVIDSAMYGVLFIDEAYALTSAKGSNDFGSEAVQALLKRMDDERDKFAVIVAGYTQEMQDFIRSNHGLESRFSNYFFFNDYTPDELLDIFKRMVMRKRFEIEPEALQLVNHLINRLYHDKTASFGNGRMVRNFYEKLVKAHSNRIANMSDLPKTDMVTFTVSDVENAEKMLTSIFSKSSGEGSRKPLGF
ncbi:MAG: AAA family ATPase [Lentimicrobiaceae bacterium]|nr:AAA family ATPase [Lentimicrobiaceae bacterium]